MLILSSRFYVSWETYIVVNCACKIVASIFKNNKLLFMFFIEEIWDYYSLLRCPSASLSAYQDLLSLGYIYLHYTLMCVVSKIFNKVNHRNAVFHMSYWQVTRALWWHNFVAFYWERVFTGGSTPLLIRKHMNTFICMCILLCNLL